MRINTIIYFLVFAFILIVAEKQAKCQESDTLNVASDTLSTVVKHSPSKAAFLSAVVPGLGQIYNGRGLFWRLPILYAGIAAEVITISYFNNTYQDFHKGYVNYSNYLTSIGSNSSLYDAKHVDNMLSNLGFGKDYFTNVPYINKDRITLTLKNNNDNFKRWRDLNIIIMAGIYFLNIVDATVQAYFFDYDVSDDLTLRVRPTIINNSVSNIGTFGMKLSFNLH